MRKKILPKQITKQVLELALEGKNIIAIFFAMTRYRTSILNDLKAEPEDFDLLINAEKAYQLRLKEADPKGFRGFKKSPLLHKR